MFLLFAVKARRQSAAILLLFSLYVSDCTCFHADPRSGVFDQRVPELLVGTAQHEGTC